VLLETVWLLSVVMRMVDDGGQKPDYDDFALPEAYANRRAVSIAEILEYIFTDRKISKTVVKNFQQVSWSPGVDVGRVLWLNRYKTFYTEMLKILWNLAQ